MIVRCLVSALCAAALTGCGALSQLFAPPGPQYQYTFARGADESVAGPATCGSVPNVTPWTNWLAQYSDGSTKTSPTIYWYAPAGESGPLGIYTGLVAGTRYEQVTTDAVNRWYNDLSNRVPANHYLRLYPEETFDSSALVQIVLEQDGQNSFPGATDYGTITGTGSINASPSAQVTNGYIAGALVHINTSITDGESTTDQWATITHELGHALGLNHNPYPSSIMYPVDNTTWHCFTYNKTLPTQDTQNLVNYYDPRINSDEPKSCAGCKVYLSQRRQVDTSTGAGSGFVPAVTTGKMIDPRYAPQRMALLRAMHWYHGTADFDFTRLSESSLLISSPLVVHGTIGPVVQRISGRGRITAVQAVRVRDVLRDALGTHLRSGDVIPLAERMAVHEVAYYDDPPLAQGTDAVLYLTPSPDGLHVAGRTAFVPTAPVVSKWLVSPAGIVSLSTRVATRVAQSVRGRPLTTLSIGRLRTTTSVRSASPAEPLVAQELARRGINAMAYNRTMVTTPGQVLHASYEYDLTHP